MNTRNKRASAIHVMQPWRSMYPVPDGVFDQGDRQQCALVYRGVLAGLPFDVEPEPEPEPDTTVPPYAKFGQLFRLGIRLGSGRTRIKVGGR